MWASHRWVWAAAAYAIAVSATTAFVAATYDLPIGYLLVLPVAVVGAWVTVWAWRTGRWWLAIVGLAASMLAPWGYLYVGPVAALVLIFVAAHAWRRSRSLEKSERSHKLRHG